LIVIKVSGPTAGAGGVGPDMAVDRIADDFDKGTRSLMIDRCEGLYDDQIDILVGGFLSDTANAQPSLG
jgi:hypothetical protein